MTAATLPMRVVAALLAAAGLGRAAWTSLSAPSWAERHGASMLGGLPETGLLWAVAALAVPVLLLRTQSRRDLALGLTLMALAATLLGGRAVPVGPELSLALAGAALWVAAPFLRSGRAPRIVGAIVLLSIPALLGTTLPHGGVLWLQFLLPAGLMGVLIPALCEQDEIWRPAALVLGLTALVAAAGLASMPLVAAGLDMPFGMALSTRLPLLEQHPNLSVPHLVVSLGLGLALLVACPRGRRPLTALAVLLLLGALAALRSRTGLGASALVLGLFALNAIPRLARLARPAWWLTSAAVVVALLLPVTELSTDTITHRSESMVSKSVSFRASMWELGRDSFGTAPWHGHGPGTLYELAAVARPGRYDGGPTDDHPHSIVLLVGGAFGWPGLLGLTLLLIASLRPPPREGTLADAALAASGLGLWATNAMDLGGATDTIYPSMIFLVLGLRHARLAESARPLLTGGLPRLLAAGGRAAVVWGVVALASSLLLQDTREAVEQLPLPTAAGSAVDPDQASTLRDRLRWLARLRPFDPAVPLLGARLAQRDAEPSTAIEALQRARALFPRSAVLAWQLGLLISQHDLDDPSVRTLIELAVALDPHGPEAWRRQLDLARLSLRRGETEAARVSVVAAVLQNPAAVAELGPRRNGPEDDAPVVLAPFPDGAILPLDDVLADLRRRRDELAELDPAYAGRFAMREVEVLRAVGEFSRADALAAELDAGHPTNRIVQLGQSSLERGDANEAVERFEKASADFKKQGIQENAWVLRFELLARAEASPLDAKLFEQRRRDTERLVHDLAFDKPVVRSILEARQRVAERTANSTEAGRLADALAFLDR